MTERLITLRRGEIIKIHDADSFFQELEEKVSALAEFTRPHPLSAKVAVATVKKYLVDDRYRIRLHDLVIDEINRLYTELSGEDFPRGDSLTAEELRHRVQRYESLTEIVLAIMITGCYWGEKSHEQLWTKSLERLTYQALEVSRSIEWPNLRLYPALLLLYGGGIASIAARRYDTFAALLTKAIVRVGTEDLPLVLTLYTWNVMSKTLGQQLPNMEKLRTPLSDYLYLVLREPLRDFLPQDIRYQNCFDRFEYLLALVYADLNYKGADITSQTVWGPFGCFSWRGEHSSQGHDILNEIESEVINMGKSWPLLEAGLFNGSVERFQSIKTAFDETVRRQHWW